MKILLVEPSYKNKYPPMGLMKISTYHKKRGDQVVFFKGCIPKADFLHNHFDRVYITTTFTFYYSTIIKTIQFYQALISPSQIYIGGIVATLMQERLQKDIGSQAVILKGLLTDTRPLGFTDGVNVDTLPLDYSILDDTDYKYPCGDSYLAYISRGCTNKCKFCSVPILEPDFVLTNNIKSQVQNIEINYGQKQNLLLLDNNILSFDEGNLAKIVEDILELGFDKKTKFHTPLPLRICLQKLENETVSEFAHKNILNDMLLYLKEKKAVKKAKINQERYLEIMDEIETSVNPYKTILTHQAALLKILDQYYRPTGRKRCVDFNQGIDARQLTEEKMQILAKLPLEPFRLAFDDLKLKSVYVKAMSIAQKYGIKKFSNYILYNFEDRPEALWQRLHINIELAKKLQVKIFSFPMKYAPIDRIDRRFVGIHWNKQYLSNIYAILNVTKGIVADGEGFFKKAFGNSLEEYLEILTMPREFVTYRKHFEDLGITQQWQKQFRGLLPEERAELLAVLCEKQKNDNPRLVAILLYYQIKMTRSLPALQQNSLKI